MRTRRALCLRDLRSGLWNPEARSAALSDCARSGEVQCARDGACRGLVGNRYRWGCRRRHACRVAQSRLTTADGRRQTRRGDPLATAIDDNPLLDVADNPSRLLVAVPANAADRPRLEPLLEQEWAPEALALGVRAAYLWCPAGVLASRLPEAVGRILDDAVTTRNWKTMLKLHALTQDEP